MPLTSPMTAQCHSRRCHSGATLNTTLPTVARFAVRGKNARPLLTDVLGITEPLRAVLMGCSKAVRPDENAASAFSGKNSDGTPLASGHHHVHYLCEAPQNDGRISHLSIYCPMGLDRFDELALEKLTEQGQLQLDHFILQFVLLGIGQPEDFGGLNEKAGQAPGLAESQEWVSRTPFVLSRHLKLGPRMMAQPEHRDAIYRLALTNALRFELQQREQFSQLADIVEVEPILAPRHAGTDLGGDFTTWQEFRRERANGGGHQASSKGFGFRLKFPEPVRGPIALGYGCHFGLGQFVPLESVR